MIESYKIVLMFSVVDGFISSTTVTNIDLERFGDSDVGDIVMLVPDANVKR